MRRLLNRPRKPGHSLLLKVTEATALLLCDWDAATLLLWEAAGSGSARACTAASPSANTRTALRLGV